MIAAQNTARQLLVVVVTLDSHDPRQDSQTTSGPRMSIENVRASVPYQNSKHSNVQNSSPTLLDSSSQFLTHLEIVPTSDVEKALPFPPTIVAFYTPVKNPLSLANHDQLDFTTVRRWHVVSSEYKLHPDFDSMQSKTGSHAPSGRTDLERRDDVHLNQIITTVQKIDGGEYLALGNSDGSLALYDPNSLAPLYATTDSVAVSSMAQSGFIFPPYSGGLNLSISPNGCIAASLADDGEMQLTCVEHPTGLIYDPTDPTRLETTITSIILSFARSFSSGVSWNDIMLLVHKHLDPEYYPQLIQSTLRALFTDRESINGPDVGKPINPIVSRVLSMAASLGFDPSTDQRNRSSMLSWLTLNIRSRALTSTSILLSLNVNGGVEWKDPEVCEIACNNIRWTLDLCKFIVDDLFEMADQQALPVPDGKASQSETDSQSMTKLLLVSSWPRWFLKMVPRVYRGFVRATQDSNRTLSPEAAPSFTRMAELIEASPLKMEPLEQLLANVDKIVQKCYKLNGTSDQAKADLERYMLANGQIPEELQDVVPRILRDVLPTIRDRMDRLSLYMEDHSWLGIREDKKTQAFKTEFVVDVHRKNIMKRKGLGKVRQCGRCGSISRDLARVRRWPQYLQTQMSRCVCDDSFAIVDI